MAVFTFDPAMEPELRRMRAAYFFGVAADGGDAIAGRMPACNDANDRPEVRLPPTRRAV